VTGDKLAAGAVTGDKLAAGAVTGDKVDVATLGKVPAAANADTLGGVSKSVWGTAVMYPGTAWTPRRSSQATWDNSGVGFAGLRLQSGGGYFLKTLDLPQGATVTKVTMYYDNVVAGSSGSLWITRVGLTGSTADDIASVNSGSTAGSSSVSMTPNLAIDNTTYAYVLYWGAGTVNNVFNGAKVEYTLPGAAAAALAQPGVRYPSDNGPSSER
jgi:hypothetical protein